uniref:C-type lectin domain-containing protein n=1 Tax=Oreochromis aureus TaxID=47969 RepID=A0AAZ1XM25_OREAU
MFFFPYAVVCHGLAVGQISSYYFLLQRPMPWVKAQEFCQKYYVDLAVLTTEEQYFTVLNATPATKVSFWLGLKRQSVSSDWQWVNGEQLGYEHCVLPLGNDPILYWLCYGALFISCIHLPVIIYNRLVRQQLKKSLLK